MKHLLSRDCQALLERYAWSRTVLAFDFDGTLAPIVARPEDAAMRPSTRSRFVTVAERYPCVVISGRARADVMSRVKGVPLRAVIGNHGLEPSRRMQEHALTVRRWLPQLLLRLASEQGVVVEDKLYSIALHYRRSRQKQRACAAISKCIGELGADVRVIGGKQVINVVPLGAPHKGMALERIRDEFLADTAIYVGDDVTDEDVFGLDQPGRLLSVRIGATPDTAASYYLRTQSEIDRLLERLIDLRAEASSHRVGDP